MSLLPNIRARSRSIFIKEHPIHDLDKELNAFLQMTSKDIMKQWMSRNFFFQAEDGIRDHCVTGVQTCALPIYCARCASRLSVMVALRFFGILAVTTAKMPKKRSATMTLRRDAQRAQYRAPHAGSSPRPFLETEARARSEERRVGKECRSRWPPY